MFVFKAAVVGAGTMGGQIAQTIAAAGIPVVLKDIKQELVDAGLQEARNVTSGQIGKLVEKGKLTEEQGGAQVEEVLGRIHGATDYAGFGDVDFVIEAVPERMEIKQAVFAELDACTPGHAILASNTSSLSITEIGDATLRPDKVVGFHYFYPASVMPLIEIIEGDDTSPDTMGAAVTFAQAIRKQPITCAEVPGFVVNRILNAGTSEIWRAQEEEGLSIKKIDEGVGAASVIPVGPYYLVNLLGTRHGAARRRAPRSESYGDRFYVPKGMQKLVKDGKLGAKTGGDGFYSPSGEPNLDGDGEPDVERLVEMLTLKTFVEACLVLEEGVATHRDIDFGLMAGAGLDPRRGLLPPFMKADVEGLDTVLERLESAAEKYGAMFGVGQHPLHAEIVHAGLETVTPGGVGADDVDLVPDRLQRLLKHEDLVLLAELADQHQDPLRHRPPPEIIVHAPAHRIVEIGAAPVKARTLAKRGPELLASRTGRTMAKRRRRGDRRRGMPWPA